MVQGLKDSGIFGVCGVKMYWGEGLKEYLKSLEGYEDFIHTFPSVDAERFEEPGFAKHVDDTLKEYKAMGIKGLKFWKNIGTTLKDSSGKYVAADDDRLRPIWESAAKYGLIALFHIADPKAFFMPVDEKNEFYESLVDFPHWSFYGEGRYTFEELMDQQDSLLTKNPDTTFIIPHMGSYAENLAWVGEQFDKHPNMYTDIAARTNLLGCQPYTAREFFIKYQDRILFGTDYHGSYLNAHEFYPDHYRFFETYDEYFPAVRIWSRGGRRWNVHGLGLPDEVLQKFYSKNALRLLGIG